jgi:hypothetical protein
VRWALIDWCTYLRLARPVCRVCRRLRLWRCRCAVTRGGMRSSDERRLMRRIQTSSVTIVALAIRRCQRTATALHQPIFMREQTSIALSVLTRSRGWSCGGQRGRWASRTSKKASQRTEQAERCTRVEAAGARTGQRGQRRRVDTNPGWTRELGDTQARTRRCS